MQNKIKKHYIIFINIIMIIAILSISNSCVNNNKNKNEVSDEIVLKIGKLVITKYEFEKNKRLVDGANTDMKKWVNEFIENRYLLADAYEKKYDTINAINKVVEYAALEHIAKVDGYVWEKVEEPKLQFSKAELKNAFKKRGKIYFIDGLYFKNRKILDSIINFKMNIKGEDFDNLVKKCKANKNIIYNSNSYQYPYSFFAQISEKIYKMNDGDVIGPIYLKEGYYLLHLIKKETVKQQTFNNEKEDIEWTLKEIRTNQIVEAKQKEIFEKTKIVINEPEINKLYKSLQINKLKISNELLNNILMTYRVDSMTKVYTVRDFWDYLHYTPLLMGDYSRAIIIKGILQDYVIRQYLYRVADSLGILKDNKYLLDKVNFKNTQILTEYIKNEFQNKVIISENEIVDYYDRNKESFTNGKVSNVSILTFNDYKAAINNSERVSQIVSDGKFFEFKDTNVIKGLLTYQPNIKIENNNKKFPPDLVSNIFSIPEGQVSSPVEYNKKCILFFVTKREGIRINQLDEVKWKIKEILENKKIEEMKAKRIIELRKKFQIEINRTTRLI